MAGTHGEWGGRREGAGRKPGWKVGPCKAIKVPIVLVDQVLAYAHQLDAGELDRGPRLEPVPPAAAVEKDERRAQVAKLVDEKAELRAELGRAEHRMGAAVSQLVALLGQGLQGESRAMVETALDALSPAWRTMMDRAAEPVVGTAAGAHAVTVDEVRPPAWLGPVTRQLEGLPRATRLLVLRLLLNHQEYVNEGLLARRRRGPGPDASERQLAQHEAGLAQMEQRVQDLALLLPKFAGEVTEARALAVNWRSRRAAAAKKSCDSIQAKMSGPPRVG